MPEHDQDIEKKPGREGKMDPSKIEKQNEFIWDIVKYTPETTIQANKFKGYIARGLFIGRDVSGDLKKLTSLIGVEVATAWFSNIGKKKP